MYPLVRDLAAEGIPVAVTCRALGFGKQAFYAWKRNPVSRPDSLCSPHRRGWSRGLEEHLQERGPFRRPPRGFRRLLATEITREPPYSRGTRAAGHLQHTDPEGNRITLAARRTVPSRQR